MSNNLPLSDKTNRKALRDLIWGIVKENPEFGLDKIREEVARHYPNTPLPSRVWFHRLFKKWKWSFDIPDLSGQLEKFTNENIVRYVQFVSVMHRKNPKQIKFLGQSVFDSVGAYLEIVRACFVLVT